MSTTIASPSAAIFEVTQTLRSELLTHSVYERIQTVQDLRVFMEQHVFAVCDFMWLLKRLQRELCGTHHPWTPPVDASLSRFINEIVLGEECDENVRGAHASHFELYLDAMQDVGASTTAIETFVESLREGRCVSDAFAEIDVPQSVREFVAFNDELATNGAAAEVAAAFCFGREDIIPDMFERLLTGFDNAGLNFPQLRHYIERHIELDGDEHGPLAHAMVDRLCGDCEGDHAAAALAAKKSIRARIQLWDGVVAALESKAEFA